MIPEPARPGMEERRGEYQYIWGGSIFIAINNFAEFHEIMKFAKIH